MLEPYSCQRDVAYIVVAPENDLVLNNVKLFFKEFSAVYEVGSYIYFCFQLLTLNLTVSSLKYKFSVHVHHF